MRRILDDADASGRDTVTITAGAGWGKTILLDQWCAAVARHHPVVRLDAAELVDSHHSLEAAIREAFLRDAAAPRDEVIGRLTIVVDDVHLIEAHADREVLRRFASTLRDGETLVLCGRSQPLGSGPLTVGRRSTVLGQADIAFTVREADELVREHGRPLHPADLADLLARTQGWPFALALLSHVLAASEDPSARVDSFVRDPGLVGDYLVAAFLELLPERIQEILLAVAVVDSASVFLAAKLSGSTEVGTILEQLCVNTALVRRGWPDHAGPRYEYDGLFRTHLLAELRRRDSARLLELHQVAATWLIANGEWSAGLGQAVLSESADSVLHILATHGPGLVFAGQAPAVQGALAMLEDRGVITGVTATLAVLLSAPYQLDSVRLDHFVRLAAEGLDRKPVAERVILNAVAVMRADGADETTLALAELERAITGSTASPVDRSSPSNLLDARLFAEAAKALGALALGDGDAALRVAVRAAESAQASARPWLALMLLDIAANAAAQSGEWVMQLTLERRIAHLTAEDSTPRDIVSAHSQFSVAAAAYQSCEPYDIARLTDVVHTEWRFLDPGLSMPPRVLAILFELDSEPNPRALYEQMERLLAVSLTRHPRTLAAGSYRFIDLMLRFEGRERARAAIERLTGTLGAGAFEVLLAHAQTHAGTAQQEAGELALESSLLAKPHAWQGSNLVLGWILLALWAAESGREEQALGRLRNALELAAKMNARRPFLASGGQPARMVEKRLGAFGTTNQFARSIVAAYHHLGVPEREYSTGPALLTPRERDLLRDLPLHQSVIEIARMHGVSPNTIKSHLRSIYQKLGAGDRAGVVDRARKLGLL